MVKILETSIVCLMVGTGIIAVAVILMALRVLSLNRTLELFGIGLGFGAVGSGLRNIHYRIKNRRRRN